jgi:uncharacterized membrane protein YccC
VRLTEKYIAVLRYAEAKESFTLDDIRDHLCLSQTEFQLLAAQIHRGELFYSGWADYGYHFDKQKINLYFTVNDKFKLLSHAELEHARKSAKSATTFATLALLVSVIASASSIYFSHAQLNSEVKHPVEITTTLENIEQSLQHSSKNVDFLKEINQQLNMIQNELQKIATQSEINEPLTTRFSRPVEAGR